MLTSRTFAPPRTCSSATSTARLEVARLDRAAEPRRAGDVRPLADHHEPGVGADLERLEPAEARPRHARPGSRRGAMPSTAAAIWPDVLGRRAAAAADDVDEAVLGELAEVAARVARLLVVLAERVRQAGVRVAGDVRRRRRARAPRGTAASRVAPSEQLTPTMSGSACSTETQNASTVWPERLRPLRSMAVNESQSGSSGATSARRDDRRLRVQRVEDRLDEQEVDAALDERRDLLRVARRAPRRTSPRGRRGRRPSARARA